MKGLYALLLHLYPRSYREEFGDELRAVFALSLADAAKSGNMEIAKVLLRELVSLPQGIFFEHLREIRKNRMATKFGSHLTEAIALFIPFLVVLVLSFPIGAIQDIPVRVVEIIRLSMIGILVAMFVVGFTRGLPRWCLPFIGFVFSVANLFIYPAIVDPKRPGFSFPPFVSRFVKDFINGGTFFVGIIILIFLSVLLATLIPALRPFYRRLRNDWTLLAFILYGITPFIIVVTFDGYRHGGPYVLASFIILAWGGWLYLNNDVPWKKYIFLLIGLTLAMAITATGTAILVEELWYAPFATWQSVIVETIMAWMWLAIFTLLSPLINLLPHSYSPSQNASPS